MTEEYQFRLVHERNDENNELQNYKQKSGKFQERRGKQIKTIKKLFSAHQHRMHSTEEWLADAVLQFDKCGSFTE